MGQFDGDSRIEDGLGPGPRPELGRQEDEGRPKTLAPGTDEMRRRRIDLQIVQTHFLAEATLDGFHTLAETFGQRTSF